MSYAGDHGVTIWYDKATILQLWNWLTMYQYIYYPEPLFSYCTCTCAHNSRHSQYNIIILT